MFPATDRPFACCDDLHLPNFRLQRSSVGPQVAAVAAWMVLGFGTIGVAFHFGQSLWIYECSWGAPWYSLSFLLIGHGSLALGIYRCYWGLWLTAFAANIAFTMLLLFVYLPLVDLFPSAAVQAAAPADVADADAAGDELFRKFQEEGEPPVDIAPVQVNRIWHPPGFGIVVLFGGVLLLYTAAAWGSILRCRDDMTRIRLAARTSP